MTQVRFLTVIFNISSTFNIVFWPEGAGIGHVLTNHVTTFPDVSLFNQRIKVYFFFISEPSVEDKGSLNWPGHFIVNLIKTKIWLYSVRDELHKRYKKWAGRNYFVILKRANLWLKAYFQRKSLPQFNCHHVNGCLRDCGRQLFASIDYLP